MMDGRPFVVFNPASGKGKGARMVGPVLGALAAAGAAAPVAHGVTRGPGDEGRLTREALAAGHHRIVAVGGDGTWSNVAQAILEDGRGAALGLVPAGTGSDLAKSIGVPGHDLAACARIVQAGRMRTIDVGRVEGRHFLNVAGFGYDIAVIEHSRRVRWLRGAPLYLYCALRQLWSFPGFPVQVGLDGDAPRRQEMLMLVVANARVFGGGFRIAPGASLEDGRLEVVAFGNMPPRRRLPLLVKLLRGTHASAPEVSTTSASAVRLRFERPPAYETDGEWNRARSEELLIEVVPGALRVLAP